MGKWEKHKTRVKHHKEIGRVREKDGSKTDRKLELHERSPVGRLYGPGLQGRGAEREKPEKPTRTNERR